MSFEFILGMLVVGGLWYMVEHNKKWNRDRRDHVRYVNQKWKDFDAGKGPEPTAEEMKRYHEIMRSRGGNPFSDYE